MFKKVLTVLLVSLFSLNSSYVFAEEITQEAQGGQIPQITICHANEGNGYVVLTVPAIVAEGEGNDGHASHEGDIIPITDQNGDEILTEEDCLIVAGDEQVNEEPVDTILSCEDVFDYRRFACPISC
jgi:hypothetical protein